MGDLKMKKHVIVGCLLIVSSMFVSACGNSSDVTTEKTSVTKQVEATGQSTSSSVDQTKYDAIITEAKKLTAEGQYKESEEKLATIPVSDLGKDKKKSRLKSKRSRVRHQRDHLNQFQMNLLNGQPRIFFIIHEEIKSKRV